MDDKDFRILAELFRNPLASHVQLGRAASVSATSARRRLIGLEEEQVIAGFFALPSASTLERDSFVATASAQQSTSLFPVKLLQEEHVVWVVRKHEGTITMCVYLPKGSDPSAFGLARETGWEISRAQPGPQGKAAILSELDWRIIDVMIDDPRAEIAELSRRTGLTARTVKDRRDALMEKKALEVRPVLLSPQGPGILLFNLYVRLKSKDAAAKVRHAVDQGLVISELSEPPALFFLCRAYTVPGVYDMQSRIAAMPEVAEVWFTINREAAIARDRMHAWVREAAAKWQHAKPRRAPRD